MKSDEHLILGFFTGILTGVLGFNFSEYFDFISYLLFISLVMIGSIFPNLIEPRNGEDHRRFFHSVTILSLLGVLLILLNSGNQSVIAYLISGFILGYTTHLLLDATSKIRLPKY